MLWCESVAPLGKPVVPEVYWMLIGSSKARVAFGSNAGAGMTMQAPWLVAPRLPITMPKQW